MARGWLVKAICGPDRRLRMGKYGGLIVQKNSDFLKNRSKPLDLELTPICRFDQYGDFSEIPQVKQGVLYG
jgi:hypothetical protein